MGITPTDEEHLDQFQDKFATLMRQYHLPEFLDDWTLTRPDLCVNLQLNRKKSAGEFCRLLQKDLLPPRLEQPENLGINLVPLRNDFCLDQLLSLSRILKLLEDDSASFKLTSNGKIEW